MVWYDGDDPETAAAQIGGSLEASGFFFCFLFFPLASARKLRREWEKEVSSHFDIIVS